MRTHEIVELIEWHEARMVELVYPPLIVQELRRGRDRWLSGVKRIT